MDGASAYLVHAVRAAASAASGIRYQHHAARRAYTTIDRQRIHRALTPYECSGSPYSKYERYKWKWGVCWKCILANIGGRQANRERVRNQIRDIAGILCAMFSSLVIMRN